MASINRRDFLATVAAGSAVAMGHARDGASAEDDSQADDPVGVDCHTHFYDPTRPEGVPWPGKGDEGLYRRVLPPEFVELARPCGITHTVVVEASGWLKDNDWLLKLAADHPAIVGVVGRLTPGEDRFADHLARLGENPLYRGIRISHDEVRHGLTDDRFLADLRLMAARKLTLDVNGGPELPADAALLAKRLPELTIVINHLANLRIDGQPPPEVWVEGMRAAAGQPRVFCKVSALVEGASTPERPAPADLDFYRPTLDAIWSTFGDRRLIYGSNWPVSARYGDYAQVHGIVAGFVGERGKVASEQFFRDNSRAAYGWTIRSVSQAVM
jgi:L-fuconolactonase